MNNIDNTSNTSATLEMWSDFLKNSMGSFAVLDSKLKIYFSEIDEISKKLSHGDIVCYDRCGYPCGISEEGEKLSLIIVHPEHTDKSIIPASVRPIFENDSHKVSGYIVKKLQPYELFGGEFISKESASQIRRQVSTIVAGSSVLRTVLETKELYDECDYIKSTFSSCLKLLSEITNSEVVGSFFSQARRNSPTNASDALKNLLNVCRFKFKEALVIDDEIQPDIMLDIDSEQFISAVVNLIVNGYLYNLSEEKFVKVSLKADSETSHLTVEDNGEGMDSSSLNRLFTPKSGDNVGREGLGLMIVKLFAQVHGGTVSVLSRGEGGGTAVRISLPVCHDSEVVTHCSVRNYIDNRYSTLYSVLAKATD